MSVDFGDHVRVRSAPETEEAGLAGREGSVYGVTTPSLIDVHVVGTPIEDSAVNVYFEDLGQDHWLAPHLIEFLDYAPGTEITVGDKSFVRTEDGGWQGRREKRWWQFWR